ncbi:MerR family transcriptional regulator [Paenibacillus glucanolyticus]|jgi:DNA-binding transcriptional MerR regulator|uniref:MerR family transcriptional regulator n=1 Tax=Paenibacillus TaxID=44249 RepID=UPI0006869F08|nr:MULTISPECIES: MerR family transcriptional regulator [Paenibacillus]ANA82413.1 MerR family transcriptional regulator [Paenibacillus glucanolyticus]AVV58848.1 MerR family transcriptional regulator [Paenibacillus glucanolyticus]OMF80195.1 MerR family transcriptional regulator [Paenibacillus glucanolyticus]
MNGRKQVLKLNSIPIQELSKQTGITVRTLRYYDQIGLLIPASKTPGKHRIYSDVELRKLQQIQFLKKLGFSLQEISDMISSREWNWSTSLMNQLDFVHKEQRKLSQMESALRAVLHSIVVEGETSWAVIQKLIQLSGQDPSLKQSFRNQMFDEREVEMLSLLPNMNSADPDSLEWIALLGQLKRLMENSPDSPDVQRIVRRMDEKRLEHFEEEDSFVDKLWEIRKSPDQSEQMGLYPIEQELLEFMELAFHIYVTRKEEQQTERGETS